MANILDKVRLAIDTYRNGDPRFRRSGLAERKGAPFVTWPAWRLGEPQWQIIDLDAYIREGFNANSLIYSAIMFKARSVTAAPLRAYTGEIDQPELLDPEHPLSRLVKRPNANQSWGEFQMAQTVFLNLAGNAYTWFDRRNSEGGVPSAMYALDPRRVYIVPDPAGKGKLGYLYAPEGKGLAEGTPLLPEDVSHVKLPNPGDPLGGDGYGLSSISPMAQSADVDNIITKYLQLFFERGTMLTYVLKYEMALDEDVIKQIKERWKSIYGGYENWEEIGVLDHGGDIKQLGMTFNEMGFDGLDERNETRILGPLGVPPILIGSRVGLERATYSNYGEARQAFWEDTFVPELTLFLDDYQYYLQSDDGGFVLLDYSRVPALRKQRNETSETVGKAFERGAATRNEYRSVIGLDATGDGDVYYISVGQIPIAAGDGKPKLPAPADESEPEAESDEREDDKKLQFKQQHSGVMIALPVPAEIGSEIAVTDVILPEGSTALEPSELHVTLVYIGDSMELGEEQKSAIIDIIKSIGREYKAMEAQIGGVGRFGKVESDGTSAIYLSPDTIGMNELRAALTERLDAAGIDYSKVHGFTPHITIAYVPAEINVDILVNSSEFVFSNISLHWAGEIPLSVEFTGTKNLSIKGSSFTPEQKAVHWKAIDRIAEGWEPRYSATAAERFEQDRRELLAITTAAKRKSLEDKATIDWLKILVQAAAYLSGQSVDDWREAFVPLVVGTVTDQGERWALALGMQFSIQNLFARDWFNFYTLVFAQEIANTTKRHISQIMNTAHQEGSSIPQIQKQLDALFDRYITGELPTDDIEWFLERTPPHRTEMIARTETMRASNAGTQEIYKDWGVAQEEWLATQDDRVRPAHLEANGQIVGIDEPFIVGGEALMYPGDPKGSAENTIQCRCTTIPVIPKFGDDQ